MSNDTNSSTDNASIKVEFAVEMKCNQCKNKIEETLNSLSGIKIVDINVPQQKLLLELNESSSSAHEIQSLIESKLGISTVIKGIGESVAAVSEIHGFDDIVGVVRFTQLLNRICLVDGVVDGIKRSNNYSLNIHQYGDLSGARFENVGDVVVPVLQTFNANDSSYPSRASFKLQIPECDLSSCIGRSLAVTEDNSIIGAGIVARASIVGDNKKRICACSGKTLWEERTDSQEMRTSRL